MWNVELGVLFLSFLAVAQFIDEKPCSFISIFFLGPVICIHITPDITRPITLYTTDRVVLKENTNVRKRTAGITCDLRLDNYYEGTMVRVAKDYVTEK